MFSLMPHRIIFVFAFITVAVNSNIYWSKRSGEHRPGKYQGKEALTEIEDKPNQSLQPEENKRFAKQYREFPLFPFSTIVQNTIFRRNKIAVKNLNLKRYLDYKNTLFRRNKIAVNNPNLKRYLDYKIHHFLHL